MSDNLSNNNTYYKTNINKDKAASDLELVQLDRLANTLFVIGTALSYLSTNVVEQSIILEQAQQLTSKKESAFIYDTAKLLALSNWIFLAAGIIFLYTSYQRFKEQETSTLQNTSLANKERLFGREMVTTGNLIRTIGYTVTAAGFEIIADSAQPKADS